MSSFVNKIKLPQWPWGIFVKIDEGFFSELLKLKEVRAITDKCTDEVGTYFTAFVKNEPIIYSQNQTSIVTLGFICQDGLEVFFFF